jgi:hypothetical protein
MKNFHLVKKSRGLEFQMASSVGFKSPPITDENDPKVSPLHIIFDLKNVLVGKQYFVINHLLPCN